jgi:sialate O-acetylesterase
MAVRGVLWYQGESNVGDGAAYLSMTKALARSFRKTFGASRLPLFFAQLAPWKYGSDEALFRFWETQKAAAGLPGMAMAGTADIGDLVDIHPTRKKPLGDRFARIALRRVYGMADVADEGPSLTGSSFRPGGARLTFRAAGGALRTSDGLDPRGFELAGDNGGFMPARAKIDGDSVVLTWDGQAKPHRARYCRKLEMTPTLTDASGIPALPFGPF